MKEAHNFLEWHLCSISKWLFKYLLSMLALLNCHFDAQDPHILSNTHTRSKLPHMHMEFGILWKPQNQSPTQVQWRSQDEKMVSKEKSPSQMYLHGKAAALKVFFSLVLFVLTMCLSWPVIKVVFIGLHY